MTAFVGSECTVYIRIETFCLSSGSSSHLISVLNVSFVSHPRCFAFALQLGIWVYSVSFGAHYAHCMETTKYWVFTDVSMATHFWMGKSWGAQCTLPWVAVQNQMTLSVRDGDWGHLWNPPPPTSTNAVRPTATVSVCMLHSTLWATK